MSTDSFVAKYVGSKISTDSLMGKHICFSIVRISLTHLGFTIYVLFVLGFQIPVAEERPNYFCRQRSPQGEDIFLTWKTIFADGFISRRTSGTTNFLAFSGIYQTGCIYHY